MCVMDHLISFGGKTGTSRLIIWKWISVLLGLGLVQKQSSESGMAYFHAMGVATDNVLLFWTLRKLSLNSIVQWRLKVMIE